MLELRLQDQHLFMKIFEDAPIGICLVSPEGKLLRVNQSICSIFGYEKEELTGSTLQALSYPDDLEKNIELRRKAMAGEIDNYRMEKRYIHKTGKVIWGLLSVTVERDDQGKIGFFISQLIDITAQKTKEEELKQTQELHQLISEHSLDIIFRMTSSGIVTYVSPVVNQQLGYTPEEIIGENGYNYWHPTDYQKWPNHNFHKVRTITHRLRHKNGEYIWFETSSKKIYNDAGKIQHIVGITRNITE
ncbi:MAG TPA: PAS domain S-box protein, partial [Bacillota bacterium]|nr:PAS domain S-box protein [Bacillota bacterium]